MSLAIGVAIGGTNILVGAVDETGRTIAKARRATAPADPDQIETAVADAVLELMHAHDVEGVGVAAAAFVSTDRQKLLFAPTIARRDHPMADRPQTLIGHPVAIENDAKAAAWTDCRSGKDRGASDMVMLNHGTGLGGGTITSGLLVRGAFGVADSAGAPAPISATA